MFYLALDRTRQPSPHSRTVLLHGLVGEVTSSCYGGAGMRRLLYFSLSLLAACQSERDNPQPLPPKRVEAVLIVHWEEAGPDFSREYPTLDGCEAARAVILNDTTARTRANAMPSSGQTPRAEPIPVPICIPA
jgi:hypothetical protein